VRADGGGSSGLVDIDDKMRSPHRDVDRLAQLCGELFAHRPALLGEVQVTDHRIGQPQHAKAQTVLATVLSLFNQFAIFQGRE
jgi:hypothetical protein